jgi:FkbM family methyltransferase
MPLRVPDWARSALRSAGLAVPPIRRLYNARNELIAERSALAAELAAVQATLDERDEQLTMVLASNVIPSPDSAASALAKLFDQKPAVVVQVGSNDGLQGDPIAALIRTNPEWQVLFIEPLPHVFRRLLANYPHSPNYRFENVAVSEKKEIRPLYYVSDEIKKTREDVPFWYDQLGSFDKNHVLKHGNGIESFVTSEPVHCEPLRDILARNRITKIDILHIDTEGYDYEVLKQVDLETSPPRAILYEHMHLSMEDESAARGLLSRVGYSVCPVFNDTLAIMRGR